MGTVRWTVDNNHKVTEIHKAVVYKFSISAAIEPLAIKGKEKWEKSEAGQFVIKHAVSKVVWHQQYNPLSFGLDYAVVAELEMKKLSEFYLKYGNTSTGNNA
jgi:sRNA-binding regulator protein Hfq